jgi:DNA polymerase (family 10)
VTKLLWSCRREQQPCAACTHSIGHNKTVYDARFVSAALEEIAALFKLAGEGYKARAYAQGAEVVEALGEQLGQLIVHGGLIEVPGIGRSLAKQIEALWHSGRSPLLERLHVDYPPGSAELSRVPGLTARRIKLLREGLAVRSLDALREACLAQRVRTLPGFGAKTEQRLLEAIEHWREAPAQPRRMLLVDALQFIRRLERQVLGQRLAASVLLAGAARRCEEVLCELDVIIVDADEEALYASLNRSPLVMSVTRAGESQLLVEGVPLRLHLCTRENKGAMLLYATGSDAHFCALVDRAQACGMSLRAEGLFDVAGTLSPASHDESAIYAALGLSFVPPELRANQTLASAPHDLIERAHLRGAVHCHTTYLDGIGARIRRPSAAHGRYVKPFKACASRVCGTARLQTRRSSPSTGVQAAYGRCCEFERLESPCDSSLRKDRGPRLRGVEAR